MNIKTDGRSDLEYIVSEVWHSKCYRFSDLSQIVTAKVAIDIGASCGPATIQILTTWPQSVVYSYEPDPVRFSLLKENTAEFSDRVRLSMTAVCGSNRDHVGSDGVHRKNAGAVWEYMAAFGSTESSAESLPAADLMKIDCEGFEWGIIEDLALLGRLPTVIVGEWHFQDCKDAITEILSRTHSATFSPTGYPWGQFLAVKKT